MNRWILLFVVVHVAAAPRVSGQTLNSDTTSRLDERVRVDLPFDARVGTAKAGKLCFPSGVLRVSDFIASNRELRVITDEASRANPPSAEVGKIANIELILTAIDASLCAKNYGMFGLGDKRSFSGRTTLKFLWKIEGVTPGTWKEKIVDLKFDSKNPGRLEDMVPQAVAAIVQDAIAWKAANG